VTRVFEASSGKSFNKIEKYKEIVYYIIVINKHKEQLNGKKDAFKK
jgi:hypothetical protein